MFLVIRAVSRRSVRIGSIGNQRTATALKLVRNAWDLRLVGDGLCCDRMPAYIGRYTDYPDGVGCRVRLRWPLRYPGRMQ
jgi:hypothetical protein